MHDFATLLYESTLQLQRSRGIYSYSARDVITSNPNTITEIPRLEKASMGIGLGGFPSSSGEPLGELLSRSP